MKESLLIACALRDVGQSDGRENHGLKARKIAERLFANKLKDNNYASDILEAIEKHDDYILSDRPLFTILVQFADKMDFTKDRLIDNYKEKADNCLWGKICNIEYIHIIINWIVNENNIIPLIKSTEINRIDENIDAISFKMDKEDYERLNQFRNADFDSIKIDWELKGGVTIDQLANQF